MFPQFKPFLRQLVHPQIYRHHSEAFITLQNLVDKFFSMAKSKRELGKSLLHRLLVDLVNTVENGSVLSDTTNKKSHLKDFWLKELAADVCRSHVSCRELEVTKIKRKTLIDLSKTEVSRVSGQDFLYDVVILENTIDNLVMFMKRNTSLLTAKLATLDKQLASFKKREFGKERFPDTTFGLAYIQTTLVNQFVIKVSRKHTETFAEYFTRLKQLPSPTSVSKLQLIWKQKKVEEKLLNYDVLLEKYQNLRRHSSFFVRKFREGSNPQSPIDYLFAQVLFYDQARLRIFDSRDYESNRMFALDIFFMKIPETLPGNPRLQHTTVNRHRRIISRLLFRKLEDNILTETSPKFLNIDGGTSKARKGEDFTTSTLSFTVFDKSVSGKPVIVEVFLPVISRLLSLKKELRKLKIRDKPSAAKEIVKNLNFVFRNVTVEKKAASKLAKCLELISENIVKLSNLAGVSSDNENKMGAFVRSITKLSKLGIGAKAAMKYEGLLHLENSILKQIVLLVTGQLDPREGFAWSGKERKSLLERYLDASSRVANQQKVKLLHDEANPADKSFAMFSTTRFKDSAVVVAQLCTTQRYLVLNKVLSANISTLNLNPTTNPHAHFVLHANKNIPLVYPLLHAFHSFMFFHTTPNFTFLGLKYPYAYLGRFMIERLTRNKVFQRLCLREIAKLPKLSHHDVSQIVLWWS